MNDTNDAAAIPPEDTLVAQSVVVVDAAEIIQAIIGVTIEPIPKHMAMSAIVLGGLLLINPIGPPPPAGEPPVDGAVFPSGAPHLEQKPLPDSLLVPQELQNIKNPPKISK
jgi:hypothetical protein